MTGTSAASTVRSTPFSPGTCQRFGEGGQDNPCLGAETFEHQYFIAKTNYIAVYKSHQAVCSFIEVVQNTYGTASPSGDGGLPGNTAGRGGGQWGPARPQGRQELAGTKQREAPGVLMPEGRSQALGRVGGRRLPLRQGARGSHHVQRWAIPPEGTRGWENSAPATLAPKQPLPQLLPGAHSPAPASSPALQRCCIPRHHLGPSPGAGEGVTAARRDGKQRGAGRNRLKKKRGGGDGARSKKRSPWVSVSYSD